MLDIRSPTTPEAAIRHRPFGTMWLAGPLLAALAAPPCALAAEPDPATPVVRLRDEVVAAAGKAWPPDPHAIAELVGQNFDLDIIAAAVLGRRVEMATPEQRGRLAHALGQLMVHELMRHRPASADGFAVTATLQTVPGEWLVVTRSTRPGEAAIQLAWRVRSGAGGLRIIDLLRDGASAVITERQDIAAALSRSDLNAVIEAIEHRAAGS